MKFSSGNQKRHLHTDRWESMFAFIFFASLLNNVIIAPTQLRSLIIFWAITLSPSCVLYHYRRSLQLIGCCSLSSVYVCITIIYQFGIIFQYLFVCLFFSFRIVSFTVSNSVTSGKCFNHWDFLLLVHCISCSAIATQPAHAHKHYHAIIASFVHLKLLNCVHAAFLSLSLSRSFWILICFPLCLQTHQTVDLFHLVN